jgi:hypothetical protein
VERSDLRCPLLRNQSTAAAFEHILKEVLHQATYASAFKLAGIDETTDLLELVPADLATMGSMDASTPPVTILLTLREQKRILRLIDWFYEQPDQIPNVWFTLTKAMFEDWRVRAVRNRQTPSSARQQPIPQTELQSFERSIKRNIVLYWGK